MKRAALFLAAGLVLCSRAAVADGYTHAFSPTAVYLKGSGWDDALVRNEMTKVQRIYDQCGIKLDPLAIVAMEPLGGRLDLRQQYDLELVTALGIERRPLVFFLRTVGIFYSDSDEFAPDSPMKSLTNTSWLGVDMLSSSYKSMRDPNYSPVAHEIAHVLCNCGHDHSGNHNILASDVSLVSDQITKEQCKAFKRSPLMRKL